MTPPVTAGPHGGSEILVDAAAERPDLVRGLRQVGDHDHPAACGRSGFDPVEPVLKYVAIRGIDPDLLRRIEKDIGSGLSVLNLNTAYHCVKIFLDPGVPEVSPDQAGLAAAGDGHFDAVLFHPVKDLKQSLFDGNFFLNCLVYDPEAVIAESGRIDSRIVGVDHFYHMISAGPADSFGKFGVMEHSVHTGEPDPCVPVDPLCIEHQAIHIENRTF